MNREEVYLLIERSYRRNRNTLVKKLEQRYGSSAEDIVQEVYTRACQYWEAYDVGQSIDAWLSGIFTNVVKDHKKDAKMMGMVKDDPEEPSAPPPAINNLIVRDVMRAIDREPERNQSVLKLFFLKQWTYKELIEATGLSKSIIDHTINRFRDKIRPLLLRPVT